MADDQTSSGEGTHGGANGCPTDPEIGREFVFGGQPVTDGELTAGDAFGDHCLDLGGKSERSRKSTHRPECTKVVS